MEGENIICFAKDWGDGPTSNDHIMRILAKRNKVLWLNSIAMRKPNLGSRNDLSKIGRKLKSFTKGPVHVDERLWVYTPIVLPLPHSSVAAALNRVILRQTIRFLRRRLGMERYQLWIFVPNAVEYVGMPGQTLVIYYCIDEWSHFSYIDGAKMADMEQRLCGLADVVFCTARALWERRKPWNAETHLALHGVDHAHFARALDDRVPVADELARLPRPILGFFGLVHEWIDLKLFAYLAERRPDWTIAIIGEMLVDVASLRRFPNIKLLGRKPYSELPRYCKTFSVGLMPFAMNELTRNVNPIKMREYLSAGLPVVSTDLPEAAGYAEHCHIVRTPEAFLAACEEAIATDSPEARRARSASMARETWEAKVEEIGRLVMAVRRRREALPCDFHYRRRATQLQEGGTRAPGLPRGGHRTRTRAHGPALRRGHVHG